ncbi:hypothetical protein MPH47_05225 [Psychrobacillus psychrodurans]|uniref:hypothetical protein n=1 Tax=Psychrobacillus psychrodurans TaxID=126157 RepID=UPI001F4E5A41|nr:hypothetical protein [Psychrobacillus psychrodurans]MCK1996649.1 hypothetical protein [Psychrobacillus psychrodurans]
MASRDSIEEEFPLFYAVIISYLFHLDKRKKFEYIFRETDKQLFVELREVLHQNPKIHDKMFTYQISDILNVLEK